MNNIKSEDAAPYLVPTGEAVNRDGDAVIERALAILGARLLVPGEALENPAAVGAYLVLHLAEEEHETFTVLFLDNRHRVIACEDLFHGTIDGCSVHPREVVKRALRLNAAAVILSHNHPSGVPEPSAADIALTKRLQEALKLVDIRVLDHVVVGGLETVSFAERGLI